MHHPRAFEISALFLFSTACGLASETSVEPVPFPAARYRTMIKQSPFAPATPATTPAPVASFATNYYVSGVAKIGSKDFVTVATRDGASRFSLMPGELGPDGVTIEKVEWSDELGKSKVQMKKGAEVGVVEFDQAALQKPPPPAPVAQIAPQPVGIQPPQGRGGERRNWQQQQPQPAQPQNGAPAQRPGRSVYPQMPQVQPQPQQAGQPNSAAPQPGESRRRIRIINSRPQ